MRFIIELDYKSKCEKQFDYIEKTASDVTDIMLYINEEFKMFNIVRDDIYVINILKYNSKKNVYMPYMFTLDAYDYRVDTSVIGIKKVNDEYQYIQVK